MRRQIIGCAAAVLLMWSLLPTAGPAAVATAGSAHSTTKTVTRDHLLDGVTTTVDSRTVSLSVAETQNLRGFQRIDVSWTGAHPTGGAVADVNDGTQGVQLEYPMVLLECRGIDSPSVPPDQQLDPTTCWTAYEFEERTAVQSAGQTGFPPFRLDMYAAPADRKALVGVPAAALGCPPPIQRRVWLRAADGTTYTPGSDCQNRSSPVPPEAQNPNGDKTLTFPSNETYASTAADGSGRASFDVLTANENATLGCSDTVACALVAVPVMGIGCDVAAAGLPPEDRPPTSTAAQAEAECTQVGDRPVGPSGIGGGGQAAVLGQLWWAASNWRNRITVPLGFAPVADPCRVTGVGKAEVDIYGAESMAEATAQWDPRFCQDPTLFTLKHVQSPEPVARNVLAKGLVSAAFSSYAPAGTYTAPVVKAPVALTGFAISFSVDDKAGPEVTSLRLNARLLAKLLTESYPTDQLDVRLHGYLAGNPLNIIADPEFRALNPQVSTGPGFDDQRLKATTVSAGTLYALATDSDVMYALTSYVINDPEAREWLNGTPDPWGTVVNPNYNLTKTTDIALPTNSWRLLDTHKIDPPALASDGTPADCDYSQSPYLGLVASPVAQMLRIAQAVEFAWPLSPLGCKPPQSNPQTNVVTLQPERVERTKTGAKPGTRFVLGLTSLGEASRFGLHTASLQSQPAPGTGNRFTPADQRTFVAPNDASLRAAASLLAPDPDTQTWQIPSATATSPSGAGAYPGTMLVDAQIPTSGLSPADAGNLAKFLRFAAGPGQQPGTQVGQLPAGYLSMTSANGMGALVAYTKAAADAVAAQSGTVPPVVPGSASPSASSSGGPGASPSPSTRSPTTTTGPTAPTATVGATTTADSGSSGPGGGLSAIGGALTGRTLPGSQASPPVPAPRTGIAGVLGKTLAILSQAGSLLRWLIYVALAALVGAGLFYYVAARRLGSKPSLLGMKEMLKGLFARRRAGR